MFGKIFFIHSSITAMPFLLVIFLFAGFAAQRAQAANLYGVTDSNQLVRFNSSSPGTVTTVAITGLQGGEIILGIDFRPATGQLYALGSINRLYVINTTSGAATAVAVLSTALSGSNFGVDFNPTVDRLRIVSNTGQNLRVNPNDGTVTVDGVLNPGTPSVTGAAYTNNFNGATTTTLFDIDSGNDTLYTQNPPNNGTLVAVGALGVNATDVNGFDISTGDSAAYAALTVAAQTGLYTINTTTGGATFVGLIGNGLTNLRGLAADIGTTPGLTAIGLTNTNQLVTFNTARPNTILSTVTITGLQTNENIVAIDFRPATGQLFGFGAPNRLYVINPTTGAATFVGALSTFPTGSNFPNYGFDFNPTVDRIRLTTDTDFNARVNPADASITVDTNLAFAAGDPNAGQNPNVIGSGYTNSFAGATTTTLYNIESNFNVLVTQNPPNNGTLNTVGRLGINITSGDAGFDIAPGSNTALAAVLVNFETTSKLYSVNLTTGAASFIGPIGGASLRGLAIVGAGTAASGGAVLDFDGDRRSDFANFRISNSTWYVRQSSTGAASVFQFGVGGSDILTPGDYDGDGRADAAVFRPSNGTWYVLRSSNNQLQTVQFGAGDDQPVQRDYDGDGRTDFAVVRRTGGNLFWYILNSSNNSFRAEQFGFASDAVAPGDYDGDGRFDLAVKRGAAGQPAIFYIQQSTAGFIARQWGLGEDPVVPGDYDGDGKTDLAVVREGSQWTWYILLSSNNSLFAVQLGAKGQFTAQADYNGDGATDVATFEPIAAAYYYRRSSDAAWLVQQFGANGDIPVANYNTY